MVNIKENVFMNFTLTEKEVYELRNDLRKIHHHIENFPSLKKLSRIFNISDNETFSEEFPSHKDIFYPEIPQLSKMGSKIVNFGLTDTTYHQVQGIFKGDYVQVSNNPFYLYRVISFKRDENNKLTLVLVKAFERYTSTLPSYRLEAPKSVEVVKQSPLRFYKEGTILYHKVKKEENWEVKKLHVSVWGHRFDSVTCSKLKEACEEYRVSVMDVIPNKVRHCWSCESPVYPQHNDDCDECRWLVCNCIEEGACGCQELGLKKQSV